MLTQYKKITLSIIEIVKAEEFEKLDDRLKERQLILNNISTIDYSKEELKELYLKYDIESLDKTLNSEMNIKKEDLMSKIKENKKRQVAMKGYNNLSARAIFLSKEI